jgi:hypothetical protein
MSSLQSAGLVLVVGAAVGFFGATAVLPGTAATRLGALCFWLSRVLFAAGVAAIGLGILEVASIDLDLEDEDGGATRAYLARTMTDVLFAGTLLGWGLVVQVIGMSSFARQTNAPAADQLAVPDQLADDPAGAA